MSTARADRRRNQRMAPTPCWPPSSLPGAITKKALAIRAHHYLLLPLESQARTLDPNLFQILFAIRTSRKHFSRRFLDVHVFNIVHITIPPLTFAQRALCAAASAARWAALNFPLLFRPPPAFAALTFAQRAVTAIRAASERDIFFRPRRLWGAAASPPPVMDSISP